MNGEPYIQQVSNYLSLENVRGKTISDTAR